MPRVELWELRELYNLIDIGFVLNFYKYTSGFFSLLASLFLPPNMPVQLFLFVRAWFVSILLPLN